MKSKGFLLHIAVMVILVSYLVFIIVAPFIIDGNVFRIDSPLNACCSGENGILVKFSGWSITEMNVSLRPEIVCNDFIYSFREMHFRISGGEFTEFRVMSTPPAVDGGAECYIRGAAYYTFPESFGARLHTEFISDGFTIEK